MDEGKLTELLKKLFYTKPELDARFATKADLDRRFNEIDNRLDVMDEKLDDLKASSTTVDDILVAHPLERIHRLEQHAGLPKYIHTLNEE